MNVPFSLEERLRVIRERCRLLADVFTLQAETAWLACPIPLSADTFSALTDLCRASADDLERLSHEIPGAIAHWQVEVAANCDAAADVQAP